MLIYAAYLLIWPLTVSPILTVLIYHFRMSGSIRADGLKLLYNGNVLAQMDESYSDVITALNAAELEYTEDDNTITVVPYGDERQISLLFSKSDNALYSVYVARYIGSISKFYYEQENANQ